MPRSPLTRPHSTTTQPLKHATLCHVQSLLMIGGFSAQYVWFGIISLNMVRKGGGEASGFRPGR